MAIFKGIDKSQTSVNEIEIYKTFSLDQDSNGINSIQFRSGSLQTDGRTPTVSGSYWNSLLVNFYLSGSSRSIGEKKYNHAVNSFAISNPQNPQYINKFHSSGSTLFIPQQYFGEKIKRESFSIKAGNVTLKDDGYGNLYSTTTTHTSSATTSISSSDNYKGNVFYNLGVITLTDTGSYGGDTYSDLTTGSFSLQFNSTQTIFVREYTISVNPGEFNSTNNPTARMLVSGSKTDSEFTASASPHLKNELTASGWNPYMNTIRFHGDNLIPVMAARYPQSIKMIDWGKLIFKVRIDF